MKGTEKKTPPSLRKILCEPVAPYFAQTYQVTLSIIQAIALGALLTILWPTEDKPAPDVTLLMKTVVIGCAIATIWHRYLFTSQYLAWRLGPFDTLLPFGFVGLEFWAIIVAQGDLKDFCLAFTFLPLWGLVAYVHSHWSFNKEETKTVLREHFDEQDDEFCEAFFRTLLAISKHAAWSMCIVSAVFAALCGFAFFSSPTGPLEWFRVGEPFRTLTVGVVYLATILVVLFRGPRRALHLAISEYLNRSDSAMS